MMLGKSHVPDPGIKMEIINIFVIIQLSGLEI